MKNYLRLLAVIATILSVEADEYVSVEVETNTRYVSAECFPIGLSDLDKYKPGCQSIANFRQLAEELEDAGVDFEGDVCFCETDNCNTSGAPGERVQALAVLVMLAVVLL